MVQGIGQGFECLGANLGLQLALPDRDAMPSHFGKLALLFLVTCLIPLYLISPKVNIGFRKTIILAAFMTMPKTAVYKNASPVFLQDNIGMTGKAWMVEPVAKATAKKKFPH